MSQVRIAEKKGKSKAFWPIIGLVLAVALGIIAWFIAPYVRDFVFTRFPNSITAFNTMPDQQQLIIFTAAVFLLLGSLVAMIVAFAVPKDSSRVKDKDLVKEQKALREEIRKQKKRKQYMAQELHKYAKDNQRK